MRRARVVKRVFQRRSFVSSYGACRTNMNSVEMSYLIWQEADKAL